MFNRENCSFKGRKMDMLCIVSTLLAIATLVMTCRAFSWTAKKNAYDIKVKDIKTINKPLCRLIKKNQYLDEMCEKCLAVRGQEQLPARIIGFMNSSAYEHLLHDLNDILCEEVLNVLVFSSQTRSEIGSLIAHIEELDGLIVLVVDSEAFRPQEIRKQICHIKEGWLRLAELFAKDLMLDKKETSEFCEATIDYANSMEV